MIVWKKRKAQWRKQISLIISFSVSSSQNVIPGLTATGTASSSPSPPQLLGNLLEIQIPGLYTRLNWNTTLGMGLINWCFNKPSRWFWCWPKSNHCLDLTIMNFVVDLVVFLKKVMKYFRLINKLREQYNKHPCTYYLDKILNSWSPVYLSDCVLLFLSLEVITILHLVFNSLVLKLVHLTI